MNKLVDESTAQDVASVRPAESRWRNVAAAVVLLGLAAVIIAQSAALGPPGRAHDPGPGGYPTLLAVALAGLAILLAFQRDTGESVASLKSLGHVAGIVALLCAYTVLLRHLGYVLATAVFLIGGMLLMNMRSIRALATTAIVVSAGLFMLFYNVFGVSLPRGAVERLLS